MIQPTESRFASPGLVEGTMKLLVFAHRPPPLHGQSVMVAAMLDGFARRPELQIACHHIDARISVDLGNVGRAGFSKIGRLTRHVAAAVRARTQNHFDAVYYIPAPGQRTPLYRDWLALPFLRTAFPQTIFQWHSAGLGDWLRTSARRWERALTQATHGRHALSLVISPRNDPGLTDLQPRAVITVPNGILDPRTLPGVPARNPRAGRLLFLGLCCREKGLFDALETVALLNRYQPGRFHLDVGGEFPLPALRSEFESRVAQADLKGAVTYHGFANPTEKAQLLAGAEAFIFPTFYGPEAMPLVLLEAMAWGVPIITTRWRALPEFLPPGYPGIVPPHQPESLAAAVLQVVAEAPGARLRQHFEAEFTLDRHLEKLAAAFRSVLPTARPGPT